MADLPPDANAPQVTWLGKLVILLFIVGCLAGGVYLFRGHSSQPGRNTDHPTTEGNAGGTNPVVGGDTKPEVEINIAYGTEKERWLKWAAEQFSRTKEGARIKLNLIPLGSLEGAQASLAGEKQIHVWTPASALYKDTFVQEWQSRYNQPAILREEPLALSPMVFVMWAERYDAFIKKYGAANFMTISQALAEPTGWDGIAQKPEWGLFKFGHTNPNESNSGLMTLTLMAYDFKKKNRDLTPADIIDKDFQAWMGSFERGISGFSNSTGNMMKEMILKGPSSFDGLCVYESVAIDYIKSAEGRWGELRVAYPERNMWNDNPYYILNASWSSAKQRQAAGTFLDFLLTVPIQKESLTHGFRPANTDVPVRFPDSPLVKYANYGLRVDPPVQAEPIKAEVINNLLLSWQRHAAPVDRHMWRYLKEAFWAKANLPMIGPLPVNALAVFGLGIFGCVEHAFWLVGLGLETGYLYLLVSNPRFQKVITAGDFVQTQKRSEDTRRELLGSLSAPARAQFEQQEEKVRQIMELSRDSAGSGDDLLLASNLDPLRKLCALHLRLLTTAARLKAGVTPDKEAGLARQVDALNQELAQNGERFSTSLRESKQATLELTRKRLTNAQRCRESLVEIESDLVRIETQLDLALENARLERRPAGLASNLNLLNQIMESNTALSNLDVSFMEMEG